jgi:hypothetical protein
LILGEDHMPRTQDRCSALAIHVSLQPTVIAYGFHLLSGEHSV